MVFVVFEFLGARSTMEIGADQEIHRVCQTYVFHVFYPLPGPGTSPIRFVRKIRAILRYSCVRSSDVVSKLALGQLVFDV